MNYISVSKALRLGWVIIGLIAFVSVASMIVLMFVVSEYDWPLYIGIPMALILPLALMIIGFQYAGQKWTGWVYLHVTDVVEFQKGSQMSGFGGYPVDNLKDDGVRAQIKERFDNYQFIDDPDVPDQTIIYFRKLYQNPMFIFSVCLFSFLLIPFIMYPAVSIQLVLFIVPVALAFVTYYKSSDRSPQIILSEAGIDVKGRLCEWKDISDYEVTQGKTSYLTYTQNDIKGSIEIDNLSIGRYRLNHLLHVYNSRSKMRK